MFKFDLRSYISLCMIELIIIFINLFLLKYGNFHLAAVTTFLLVILRGVYAILARMNFASGIIVFLTGRIIMHYTSFYIIKINTVVGFMSLEKIVYISMGVIIIDVISYIFIKGLKYFRLIN